MKGHFSIEYIDIMSGEKHSHETQSKFIAQKLVASVLDFALENRVPLYRTKLKVIAHKKTKLQCAISIQSEFAVMFRMTLFYN